jgi:hypothetical protein
LGSAFLAAVAEAIQQAEAHGERQIACRRNYIEVLGHSLRSRGNTDAGFGQTGVPALRQ